MKQLRTLITIMILALTFSTNAQTSSFGVEGEKTNASMDLSPAKKDSSTAKATPAPCPCPSVKVAVRCSTCDVPLALEVPVSMYPMCTQDALRDVVSKDKTEKGIWYVGELGKHVKNVLNVDADSRGKLIDFLDPKDSTITYEKFQVGKNEYKAGFKSSRGLKTIWRTLPEGTYSFLLKDGKPFLELGQGIGTGNLIAKIEASSTDTAIIAQSTKATTSSKETNSTSAVNSPKKQAMNTHAGDKKEIQTASMGGGVNPIWGALAVLITVISLVILGKSGVLNRLQQQPVAATTQSSSQYYTAKYRG